MKQENNYTRNIILFYVTCFLLYVVDRWSKLFFINNPNSDYNWLIVKLHLTFNENLAFSLPAPKLAIIFLTIGILLFLIQILITNYQKFKLIKLFSLGLIIIGALSNLVDRCQFGGVIDFVDLPYFTVFNLADSYITIGVIGWLFQEIKKG